MSEGQQLHRKSRQSQCFISTDPAENADNFDPNWAAFKDIQTNEEKFKAIRHRWGNFDIPDPKVNLTYRHNIPCQFDPGAKENCFMTPDNLEPKFPLDNHSRRNKKVSRRRSRSCTRPYEQRISNLRKNYEIEYSWLLHKQSKELDQIENLQYMQKRFCNESLNLNMSSREGLEIQQKLDVLKLLTSHYNEIKNFIGKRNEDIETCKRYMEEVKCFFNLYQKVNDDTVTVQMTDEQYLHTVETEKILEHLEATGHLLPTQQ